MVILVSEKDPRAKRYQGAQNKVREGSESSTAETKVTAWAGQTNNGEPDRDSSSLQLLWNSWTLAEFQGNDYKKQPGPQIWSTPDWNRQTDLDMLLPSPQYSHSQSLLTWPHSAHTRRGSGASPELFLLPRMGFPGSREWLQQEWGCSLTLRRLRIKRHHHLGPHAPPSCQGGHAVL